MPETVGGTEREVSGTVVHLDVVTLVVESEEPPCRPRRLGAVGGLVRGRRLGVDGDVAVGPTRPRGPRPPAVPLSPRDGPSAVPTGDTLIGTVDHSLLPLSVPDPLWWRGSCLCSVRKAEQDGTLTDRQARPVLPRHRSPCRRRHPVLDPRRLNPFAPRDPEPRRDKSGCENP